MTPPSERRLGIRRPEPRPAATPPPAPAKLQQSAASAPPKPPKPVAPAPPAALRPAPAVAPRPAVRREQANGYTLAAIITGTLGIALGEFAPLYLFWLPLALGVVATVCGVIGSRRRTWRRSWIGTVLGVAALIIGLIAARQYDQAIEKLQHIFGALADG